MFVLALLHQQFLGGGAGGGEDAEEVGAAGPRVDVKVGFEVRGGGGVWALLHQEFLGGGAGGGEESLPNVYQLIVVHSYHPYVAD